MYVRTHHGSTSARWLLMMISSPDQTMTTTFILRVTAKGKTWQIWKHLPLHVMVSRSFSLMLQILKGQAVFEKRMYLSREMQYEWSSSRETRFQFAQVSLPRLFGTQRSFKWSISPNFNKPVWTFVSGFAYMWTSYSVISQTAEDTETKRWKGNALSERCS